MCIYFIFSKIQSLCACHPEGIFCPSIELIEKCCYGDFENCSYFKAKAALKEPDRNTNDNSLNSFEDNNKKSEG